MEFRMKMMKGELPKKCVINDEIFVIDSSTDKNGLPPEVQSVKHKRCTVKEYKELLKFLRKEKAKIEGFISMSVKEFEKYVGKEIPEETKEAVTK